MGKIKGKTPSNNQVQNKQIIDLTRKYKLNHKQVEELHELIHGEGYGYHEIEELIKDYFF
jgi:hypothetical protein